MPWPGARKPQQAGATDAMMTEQTDRVADEVGDLLQAQLVLRLDELEARLPQGLDQRLVKLVLGVPAA